MVPSGTSTLLSSMVRIGISPPLPRQIGGRYGYLAVVAAQASLRLGTGGVEGPRQLDLVEGAGAQFGIEAYDRGPGSSHRVGIGIEEHVDGDIAPPEGVVGSGEVLVDGYRGPLSGPTASTTEAGPVTASPPAKSQSTLVAPVVPSVTDPPLPEFHRQVADERFRVEGLADRGDHLVAAHREVRVAAGHRLAAAAPVVVAQRHPLTEHAHHLALGVAQDLLGSRQRQDGDALLVGGVDLLGPGGHLLALAAVEDGDVLRRPGAGRCAPRRWRSCPRRPWPLPHPPRPCRARCTRAGRSAPSVTPSPPLAGDAQARPRPERPRRGTLPRSPVRAGRPG